MSRKYKKYYEINEEVTDGRVKKTIVYKGDRYRFDMSDEERKKSGFRFLILAIVNIIFFAAAGMLNGTLSRLLLITVPYAVEFLPGLFLISSSFKFMMSKGDLTYPEYKLKFERINIMAYINLFLSTITTIESFLYLLINNKIPAADEVMFVIFSLGIGTVLVFVIILHYRIKSKVNICF